MSKLSRPTLLAVGLLSSSGCSDDAPTQHGRGYADAFAGFDSGTPIVRASSGSARDAASPARADASVSSGNASDASVTTFDAGDVDASATGATDATTQHRDAARDRVAPALVDAGPPPPRPVTIRFKAVVGTADTSCGLTYTGVGTNGSSAYLRDFRFFVQDLRLINAAGKDVPVSVADRPPFQAQGVSLIDFETGSSGCAGTAELNTEITGTVPSGDYLGIAFTNGVPDALNHGDPAGAPAPLRARGMNVSRLSGYRFLRAELVQSGAAPDMTGSVELHVNSSGCSGDAEVGTAQCSKPNRVEVRLLGFDPGKNLVLADLSTLFATVDVRAITVCHGELDLCDPLFGRLGIAYDTGKPSGAQQLYRVGQ